MAIKYIINNNPVNIYLLPYDSKADLKAESLAYINENVLKFKNCI